jgi:hypothetical protein
MDESVDIGYILPYFPHIVALLETFVAYLATNVNTAKFSAIKRSLRT